MQLDVNTDDAFRSFLPGAPIPDGEDDPALLVRFFTKPKLMGAKSEAAKRPVYEDREYIEVVVKGQPHGIPHEEVKDAHRHKYPRAYARFLAGKQDVVIGTPVELLPGVGPSMALTLKGMNLRTIEDIAGISDEQVLQRIGMGARELHNRAKAWIEQQAPKNVALEAENKRLAAENAQMRGMLGEMNERLKALEAAPKVGRKKRAAQAAAG